MDLLTIIIYINSKLEALFSNPGYPLIKTFKKIIIFVIVKQPLTLVSPTVIKAFLGPTSSKRDKTYFITGIIKIM